MNVEIPNNPIYFLELNYSKDCLTTLVSDNYNHIKEEFRNKNNKIKISLKIYNKILKHI
jgi:predicted Zn-dependent protease with MMP-like domain